MYKSKKCNLCGEMKLYDCEQCYGVDDTQQESTAKPTDKCSNQCSKDKKNHL